MCGLCGWVGTPVVVPEAATCARMAAAIAHRGPDGDGVDPVRRSDGQVAGWFGHRRLRILDLSEAANQPMVDGPVTLVFNGEIYNFRELRQGLRERGHSFTSTGDTEVVLHAFQEWGRGFAERLDGMFAIALWDGAANELHLVRDRIGKKPLFFAHRDGRLTFASEVKSLAEAPWVPVKPDLRRIPELLTFGYVPWPSTIYEGIEQVPPAGHLVYRPADDHRWQRQYWRPPKPDPATHVREVVARIQGTLETATQRRMVADVPVGCLLSGGIDSSLIAAQMTRHAEAGDVRTFAVGLADEASFDERSWAKLVADELGTKHTEYVVKADAVGLLDQLIHLHDGPFADSSAVPTYLICGLAREDVTVVLTGDGGDEIFGGYERFVAAKAAQRIPPAVVRAIASVTSKLDQGTEYNSVRKRIERFASSSGSIESRYLGWISIFGDDALHAMLAIPVENVAAPYSALLDELPGPALDRVMHTNFRSYLVDDLAVKIDRMSMAHSLEARAPFLDTAMVELLARVPGTNKVGMRHVKPLLRRALEPAIPKAVWRRQKHGFGAPVDAWFRGPLTEVAHDELLAGDARIASLMRPGAVARLHQEHTSGAARHGSRLWTLLTLERWLRACERPRTTTVAAGPLLDADVV